MVKIIGKRFIKFLNLLFCVLTFFSISADTTLKLRLLNAKGADLKKTGIGVPFILSITVESDSDVSDPEITGLGNFAHRNIGTSSSFSMNNGVFSVLKKYNYELKSDNEGKYKIGPAKIFKNNQEFISNVLEIEVGTHEELSQNHKIYEPAFLIVKVDKEHAVIGEKINLSFKFYFNRDVKPIDIEVPDFKDFTLRKKDKINTGTEEINGELYYYQEWESLLFPKKIGELVFPSIKGHFELHAQNNFFDHFSHIFGSQTEKRSLLSKPVKFYVSQLPKEKTYQNKKINGVGAFTSFKANVNQDFATQGEGIVLKLEIEGDGNFEDIEFSDLNMPANIRYYDSKNYIDNYQKKVFEFILQAKDTGILEIPAQEFNYYNPANGTYNNLNTQAIKLNIKPVQDVKKIINQVNKINQDEIKPIYENYFYSEPNKLNIKLSWFFIALLFPVLVCFLIKFRARYYVKSENNINNIYKSSNIYSDFISFFAIKFNINKSEITPEIINNKLSRAGFSDEIIHEWGKFFSKILKFSFDAKIDNIDEQDLLTEANYWINLFKKKL